MFGSVYWLVNHSRISLAHKNTQTMKRILKLQKFLYKPFSLAPLRIHKMHTFQMSNVGKINASFDNTTLDSLLKQNPHLRELTKVSPDVAREFAQKFMEFNQQATGLFNGKHYDECIQLCKDFIESNQNPKLKEIAHHVGYYQMGCCLVELENFEEAVKCFDEFIRTAKSDQGAIARGYYAISCCFYKEYDYEKALRYALNAKTILKKQNDQEALKRCYELLTVLYARLGKLQDAQEMSEMLSAMSSQPQQSPSGFFSPFTS